MLIEKKLDLGFKIGLISGVLLILVGLFTTAIALGIIAGELTHHGAIAVVIAGIIVGFGIGTIWLTLKRYELV